MDAASLFKQSTPFRRLAVASVAGILLAVVLGTLNVVGGFVVTDRMLEMFRKKK